MRLVDRKNVNVVVVDGDLIGGLMNSNVNEAELKILYSFINRIDCTKAEAQTVIFEHGEAEEFFNDSNDSTAVREVMKKKALRLGKTFRLLSSKNRNVFSIIQIFERISFDKGEDGLGRLSLTCTKAAVESVFKPELINYFKFKLRYLLELSNKFSCMLFLHLENLREENTDKGVSYIKVKYTIDELKKILKCDPDSYSRFADFNQKVLKKCHSEINSKTLLHFEYEPVDKDENRFFTAVEFTVFDTDTEHSIL